MSEQRGEAMRRIKRISITNLFGIFDYNIQLNTDERVTIIHSPNGFGKTTILKLLNELFTRGTSIIRNTPFDELHIYFDDETHFWIEKQKREDPLRKSEDIAPGTKTSHILCSYEDAQKERVFAIELNDSDSRATRLRAELQLREYVSPAAEMAGESRARETYEETLHSLSRMILEEMHGIERHEERTHTSDSTMLSGCDKERDLFQKLRTGIPVRFIDTQRLLNVTAEARDQSSTRRSATFLAAVRMYSEELSAAITAKLADSSTLTQSLDRTFPSRLVDLATRQREISEHELRENLAELEAKRKALMAVGLADQNARDPILATKGIDASTKAVLSLYIEDTRQKLAVFDDIAPRIELLTRIMNKHFLYKSMTVSRKDGFVFTTPRGIRLALEHLSSGEQHELVLFYELLFKALPGSFIMIDEPEISLHVVWQEQFLQDVQEITRLADIDLLIATHSPDVIAGHRHLVVELEGPEDGGL